MNAFGELITQDLAGQAAKLGMPAADAEALLQSWRPSADTGSLRFRPR